MCQTSVWKSLPYEIQERDIPFVPIDLSRIVYHPNEGAGSDNVKMAFRDNWLLGHLLPCVLFGMDSFFESHGLDWSSSNEIQEQLPSEDRTCSEQATLELLSFSFPHNPMVQFNVRRLRVAIARFFHDSSVRRSSMSLSTSMGNSPASFVTLSKMSCCLPMTAVSTTCMPDKTHVESAVEEMSAAMDVAIADSQKMLFSNVKTSVVDPKQQRAPTSILKCRTKTGSCGK
jgi:hypothetical protein